MKFNNKRKFCQYVVSAAFMTPVLSDAKVLSALKIRGLNVNLLNECHGLLILWQEMMDVSPYDFLQQQILTSNKKTFRELVTNDFKLKKTVIFNGMVLSQTEVSLLLNTYLKVVANT